MNLHSNGHQSEVISKTNIENTIGLPLVSHRVTAVLCVFQLISFHKLVRLCRNHNKLIHYHGLHTQRRSAVGFINLNGVESQLALWASTSKERVPVHLKITSH